MQALEHRQQVHYESRGLQTNVPGNHNREYKEDPCICVVGGFGLKQRDLAIQHVKTVLSSVAGIVKNAPSYLPKICFVPFSTLDGMRDFIYRQKSNPNFGRDMMWASPSKSLQEKKYRTICGIIKRGMCEHLRKVIRFYDHWWSKQKHLRC